MPKARHFFDLASDETTYACGVARRRSDFGHYFVGSHLDGRSILRFTFGRDACGNCTRAILQRLDLVLGPRPTGKGGEFS